MNVRPSWKRPGPSGEGPTPQHRGPRGALSADQAPVLCLGAAEASTTYKSGKAVREPRPPVKNVSPSEEAHVLCENTT